MLKDLLTPESQADPYIWSAVLLAHAMIGVMGWVFVGWWILPAYAAFEAVQAAISRRLLLRDSLLDLTGVCLGAAITAMHSAWAAAALIIITTIGIWRRYG